MPVALMSLRAQLMVCWIQRVAPFEQARVFVAAVPVLVAMAGTGRVVAVMEVA